MQSFSQTLSVTEPLEANTSRGDLLDSQLDLARVFSHKPSINDHAGPQGMGEYNVGNVVTNSKRITKPKDLIGVEAVGEISGSALNASFQHVMVDLAWHESGTKPHLDKLKQHEHKFIRFNQ